MIKTVSDLAAFGKFRVNKNSRGYYQAQFKRNEGLEYTCQSNLELSMSGAIDNLITKVNRDYKDILMYDKELKEEN